MRHLPKTERQFTPNLFGYNNGFIVNGLTRSICCGDPSRNPDALLTLLVCREHTLHLLRLLNFPGLREAQIEQQPV